MSCLRFPRSRYGEGVSLLRAHVDDGGAGGLDAGSPLCKSIRWEGIGLTYEVIIQEYTPEWIEEFEKEKLQIHHALNDKAISIEHIGSTSIVGLPAKPIVDIAVGVNLLNDADLFIEPLKELGYEYVPKMEFPNRRFFRKGLWRKGTHHLHVYEITSE